MICFIEKRVFLTLSVVLNSTKVWTKM